MQVTGSCCHLSHYALRATPEVTLLKIRPKAGILDRPGRWKTGPEEEMNLRVETRSPRPGVAIIALIGEVDVYTSPRVKQEIVNLLNGDTTRIIVDLTAVEYLDSTGLGVLIGGLKRTRERDGDLKLICDNVRILRIFEITGLTKIFDIYRNEAEALEKLE